MEHIYESEKTFEKINSLPKGEYENCIFKNCNFENGDLKDIKFYDCQFINCNLSLVKIANTIFRDVKFSECKMLGMSFESCNEYGLTVSFNNCNLNHSSFYKRKICKTKFANSQLHEVDFTECDLNNSQFNNCDLANTKFANTNIEKADFRTSFNYSINLDLIKIKKAKFSLPAITGLLSHYDIEIE